MTKINVVAGYVFDGNQAKTIPIVCRVTVDKRGATLSLSDDKTTQFVIALEDVDDMIKPVFGGE